MIHIAYADIYRLPLPGNHRFPMLKYELIPEQLLYEGTIRPEQLFRPESVDRIETERVHDRQYIDKLLSLQLTEKEIRKSGFPLSRTLIEREFIITGGTCACADYALEQGISFNVAGGTHHASSDQAEGFCLLNDQAVAAAKLLNEGKANNILIIDLDVHQGNGTAAIFKDVKDVFTFSMHAGHNYPLQKETSDLDIALPDGCDDESYLSHLDAALEKIDSSFQPDFIFYQSGVDVLKTDKLGRLHLSREGCKQRDQRVLTLAQSRRIPIVVTMGGGYSENINDIVEAHCNTFRLAAALYD